MLKPMKITALGQIESGKRKAGTLIFFSIKNLGGTVDILCSQQSGLSSNLVTIYPFLTFSN